ncbi:MAG: YifB family Mg chelatase-like AAA ATPase, partial [Longimicrobiales bacterium]
LLDRIDLHVDVPALSPRELQAQRPGEPSAAIRARVVAARERQLARLRYCAGVFANAQMGVREVRQYCRLERDAEVLLRTAMERLGMSARAYHRTLRIARTIADLGGAESIATEHLAEAIQYRKVDRRLAVEA